MNQLNIFKSRRGVFFLSAAFLLALSVTTGCKKETSKLGAGALSVTDLLASGGVDTFQLQTFSVSDNDSRTDHPRFAMLGAVNDPKTGTFESSFYTQVRLGGSIAFSSNDAITIDSMVLALEYGGYYGKLTPQNFEVYEIGEMMSLDSSYYRTSSKFHSGGNLMDPHTSSTITPNPSGKVFVGTDTLQPQLRLRLDTNFARQIITDAQAGNTAFTDISTFTSYLKGFHVKVTDPNPAPGTGGIFYFRISDVNTKMTIYYHAASDPNRREFDFLINSNCAVFNSVNITNTAAVMDVINNPSNNSQEQFYAQSTKTRGGVLFPSISDLPAKAVVHDALLVLPVSYQSATPFYPSATILIGYKDPTTGLITGFGSVDYDDASKSYIVNVRSYLQSIILGDAVNTGLYFYPAFMGGTAERIIFNGPNTPNKDKPKLIVKYTEY